MNQSEEICKIIRTVHCEIEEDSLDAQEAAIIALQQYLKKHASILFPSFIYPLVGDIFTYYWREVLPQRHILNEAAFSAIRKNLDSLRHTLHLNEWIARKLEKKFEAFFLQVKEKMFDSVEELAAVFLSIVTWQAERSGKTDCSIRTKSLQQSYRSIRNSPFNSKHVVPFFEDLIDRLLSDPLRAQFLRMEDLFWEQLFTLIEMKVVLVDTRNETAVLSPLIVESALHDRGVDMIQAKNIIDEEMKFSFDNAVHAARIFLEKHFPEVIHHQFIRVECHFQDLIASYQDTSASLMIAVKIIGDLLDLEIDPAAVISGAVDERGNVFPVKHIPQKIHAVERYPNLQRFLLPHKSPSARNTHLEVLPVRTLTEAVERYYGRQQLRNLRHQDDWGDAPEIPVFFGREEELHSLEQWIVQERCRLIAIVGLRGIGKTGLSIQFRKGGIGKTDLSLTLAHNIQHEFDFVIWRSLRNAPPLDYILADLIRFLSKQRDTELPDNKDEQISKLLAYLQKHRCFVILDNVETILQGGEVSHERTADTLAKHYREGFEGYGEFFKRIGEVPHQSCLLLTSREKPREVILLAGEERPVRLLELEGLHESAVRELFNEIGHYSGTKEDWKALIEGYNGNPLALELAARYIRDKFEGNIAKFLQTQSLAFDNLYNLLDWHFGRLTEREKEMVYWLAINRESVSEEVLQDDLVSQESKKLISNTLQTLSQRLPIEKSEIGVTLQPVLIEYLTRQLIEQVGEELLTGNIKLLNSHALIKALAKDYVRESQIRLILKPILSWSPIHLKEDITQILARLNEETLQQPGHYIGENVRNLLKPFRQKVDEILGSQENLDEQLQNILSVLQKKSPRKPGYAGGNIFNLLCHLKDHEMKGEKYDFSNLAVWQAYFQGVRVQNINFAFSDLAKCTFTQTFGNILSVALSFDGKYLLTGDASGSICIWQFINNTQFKQYQAFRGHTNWTRSVAFSPDGKLMASSSDDLTVKIWNIHTEECVHVLPKQLDRVRTLAFSPNGRIMASGGDDHAIRLWDVYSGKCLCMFQGHFDRIRSITMSPDGQIIISGSEDQTVKIWDISTGECIRTLKESTNKIRTIAFNSDRRILVTGGEDHIIRIWNTETGENLHSLQGHSNRIWSVAISYNGEIAASAGDDKMIRIWDVSTGQCLQTLQGHTNRIWSIAFGTDGNVLISGSDDQTIRIWRVDSGQCLNVLQGHASGLLPICFKPDGKILVSGGDEDTIKIWDVYTGKYLKTLKGHTDRLWSMAFSLDGKVLASGSDDQTVKIWDIATGQCLKTFYGHRFRVGTVDFSSDGNFLASGSDDQTIKIWVMSTQECFKTLKGHSKKVSALTLNFGSNILASGSADKTIRLWDVRTGQCLKILREHSAPILSIKFHPNGKFLASGSEDGLIMVWNVKTLECLHVFEGHSDCVWSIDFSPDGQTLASGSEDRTLRLWNIHNKDHCRILQETPHRVWSIAFSPDSKTIVTSHGTAGINLWDVRTGKCLKVFKSPKPYEDMDITGVTGLTEAQKANLKTLGATEKIKEMIK